MADMNVESMNKLPIPLAGNSLQHSARDVVPHSTPTDCGLSKKQLVVLLALFRELLNNTLSPDVRFLAASAAIDEVAPRFMSVEEAKEIVIKLMKSRQSQMMDSMF